MTDPVERALTDLLTDVRVPGPPGDPAAAVRPRARRMLAGRVLGAATAVLLVLAGSLGLAATVDHSHRTPTPAATRHPSPTPTTGGTRPVVGSMRTFTAPQDLYGLTATGGDAYGITLNPTNQAGVTRVGPDGLAHAAVGDTTVGHFVDRLAAGPTGVYAATTVSHKFTSAADRLWRLDPHTLATTAQITLPDGVTGLATTSKSLYVATFTTVLRLDPDSLAVQARYTTPNPTPPPVGTSWLYSLAATDSTIWAAFGDARASTLLRLDPTNLAVLGRTRLPAGQGDQVVASSGGAWLTTQNGARPVSPDGTLGRPVPLARLTTPGLVTRNGDLVAALEDQDQSSRLVRYDRLGHLVAGPQHLRSSDTGTVVLDGDLLWTGGGQHAHQYRLLDQAASTSPPPSPRSDGSGPRCTANVLRLGFGSATSPMTGEHGVVYTLTNNGGTPCHLYGYPGVTLYDTTGKQLPFHYQRGHSQYLPPAAPTTVVLQPADSARFLVAKYRCDLGSVTDAATVRVYPPGSTTALTGPASPSGGGVSVLSYCRGGPNDPGQTLAISPIQPPDKAASRR